MPESSAVGAAISALLRVHGHDPEPGVLASAIGSRLGATHCIISIDDEKFTWVRNTAALDGAISPDGWAHVQLHRSPLIAIAVAPSWVSPGDRAFGPLALVLGQRARSIETDRLRRRAEQSTRTLADHRWRATAEMEHERRRLERNLHDGAQHHLVAVRLGMALAEHEAATLGRDGVQVDLRSRLDDAERTLVDTARGVLPAALAAGGLVGAFRAIDAKNDLRLFVPSLRFHPTVESTVYYLALEAINNARKYAPGVPIEVRVRNTSDAVEFLVSDEGPGFLMDRARTPPRSLMLRAASVGGRIWVDTAPGRGTRITGRVPHGTSAEAASQHLR